MSGWIRVSDLTSPTEAACGRLPPEGAPPAAGQSPFGGGPLRSVPASLSPSRRAWQRFRRNRLGFWSLVIFCALFVLSLGAELISNDKPLVARYSGQWYFPILKSAPETTFGGDFQTPTDFLDPFIQQQFAKPGNWALYPPNPYHHGTINYFAKEPNPAPPSADNWMGTDDRGRDVAARLEIELQLGPVPATGEDQGSAPGPAAGAASS